ncbi:hypothetical protein ACQP3J_33420, partial [Escherichia coli]
VRRGMWTMVSVALTVRGFLYLLSLLGKLWQDTVEAGSGKGREKRKQAKYLTYFKAGKNRIT